MKINIYVYVFLLTGLPLFGLAEPPEYLNEVQQNNNQEAPTSEFIQPIDFSSTNVISNTDAISRVTDIEEMAWSDIELFNQRKKIKEFIELKQYNQAYSALTEMPESNISKEEQVILEKLTLYKTINEENNDNIALFKREDELPEQTEKKINRLYKGAQYYYLMNDESLAKDFLIQTLYFDRLNFKAKKLLEMGLNIQAGEYKVENIEEKYWKQSLVNMYSGYPQKAVKNLEVLEVFDPSNPLIFERMGSAYYSMGEPKKAVQAWNRAVYLNPSNEDLKTFIQNAEKEIQRQETLAKKYSVKKEEKEEVVTDTKEWRLLRVVSDTNSAYSYAQKVRDEQKGIEVVVEELENGKWAVKIPKETK
jgi:tetratricopeptide (TPR) repeat protein